jgi:phosphoenolpyruvate carboxylase
MLVIAERVRATRDGRRESSYGSPEALLDDLLMVQRSLARAGAGRAAHGELQHLIWSVQTFGFHLVELEVRQHSRVHRAALLDLVSLPGVEDAASLVDDADYWTGWRATVARVRRAARRVDPRGPDTFR